MTDETAIKIIKRMSKRIDAECKTYEKIALKIACTAIQKQIPEPPIDKGHLSPYVCPICDGEVEAVLYGGRQIVRYSYCPFCGKEIDWSEKE